MTDCKFESTITGDQNQKTPVDTDIDENETDTENLDRHIGDIGLSPASNDGVSVSTTWPGASQPTVTDRASGETVRAWMVRHEGNCAAALAADPIDC